MNDPKVIETALSYMTLIVLIIGCGVALAQFQILWLLYFISAFLAKAAVVVNKIRRS